MLATRKQAVAIYVDRSNPQWIVRDPEGNFWTLPQSDKPWDDRRPVYLTEDMELEPVPGHYRYLLELPF